MIMPEAKKHIETFRLAFLLMALAETLSFFAFLYPAFSSAAFVIIMLLTAVLAWVRFDLAFMVLLAELFLGSQGGYLFSFAGGSGGLDLSLRMGLFLVLVGAWSARQILAGLTGKKRAEVFEWARQLKKNGLWRPLVALAAVFAFGLIRGLALGNETSNVFFDANGYAYFGLFPVCIAALASATTRERAAAVFSAAVAVSVAKALFVLYVFSHRMFSVAPIVYVWIRDTRVGEITRMVGDFYRVFFQSHVFAMVLFFAAFLALVYARPRSSWRPDRLSLLFFVSLTGLLMGFSRSYWFGAGVASLALAAVWLRYKASFALWKRAITLGLSGVFLSIAAMAFVYSLPFPQKGAEISFASIFGERAFSLSGEAAANSRWALLPKLNEAIAKRPLFGNGLGTTVTYTTSDPRLLADNPGGAYTTYAFEWGYHDLVVKFGLVGLGVYLWLLAAVIRPLWRFLRANARLLRNAPAEIPDAKKAVASLGLLAAFLAFLATNVFSPYLNHPLGIGIIMLTAAIGIYDFEASTEPTKSR